MKNLNKILKSQKKIWDREGNAILTEEEINDYDKTLTSDLPILMFLLDDKEVPVLGDHRLEYIYYLPDLEQVRCISVYIRKEDMLEYTLEQYFLPSTLDLRSYFVNFNIQSLFKSSTIDIQHHSVFFSALGLLKNSIDDVFYNNNIKSWEDVRHFLLQNKGLKLERVKE